jgi:N-methylhydantoinase A
MRLIGQAHEITVELAGPAPTTGDEARLAAAFEATYSRLYGRTPPNVPMQVVSWRVRLIGPSPALQIGAADPSQPLQAIPGEAPPALPGAVSGPAGAKASRQAYFPELGGYHETAVYDRYQLGAGASLGGPAIVEERESTVVIGPGARARVDEHLNLVVELPS